MSRPVDRLGYRDGVRRPKRTAGLTVWVPDLLLPAAAQEHIGSIDVDLALDAAIRVRILRMLAKRDARMCADIVDELPLAQSTVSEHLRVLRAAGLIAAREDGVRTGYCIDPTSLRRLKALLEHALPTPRPALQHQS